MKPTLFAVLLGVLLNCCAACAEAERFESTATMKALAPILGFADDAPIEPFSSPPDPLPGEPELRWIVVDGVHVLIIDETTETLEGYGYLNRGDVPIIRDEPMTEDEAVSLAKSFLMAVGIERDFKEATITYVSDGGRSGSWRVMFYDYVDGIKSMSGVFLHIAAFSNQIVFFKVLPLEMPDSLEQKVTEEEALKAALAFASAGKPGSFEVASEPLELIIRRPLMTLEPRRREKPRLYWRVRLVEEGEITSDCSAPPVMYVDCLTGEVSSF